jgi:hypothetical protein
MYKLIKNLRTAEIDTVKYIGNGFELSIPFNQSNTDYQEYLAWLDEGNTPEPAEVDNAV